jgi:glycyl-tRNA synthetase
MPAVLKKISFKKSMRWSGEQSFSRPIRWIFAMHGDEVVPLSFAGLIGGSETRLLRNSDDPVARIKNSNMYFDVMMSENIITDPMKRKDLIWAGVVEAASKLGGMVPDSSRGGLLSEVSNLVESPTIVVGEFGSQFLQLPKDILVMVMRKHQRYFPVYQPDGENLLPYFVTVANGPIQKDLVKVTDI